MTMTVILTATQAVAHILTIFSRSENHLKKVLQPFSW